MAEAIVVISFVSAIAGLVDISCRVVKRLNDFHLHSKSNKVPKALQHVKEQLPLIIDSVQRTEEISKCGSVDEETQKALIPALDGCKQLLLHLDENLEKVLPSENDSSWDRTRKALRSISKDKDFQSLLKELDRYLSIFTFHNSSESKKFEVDNTAASRIFMIPTTQDLRFVDRPDLFEELDLSFKNYGRAALAGIGGAGKTQIAIEYCYRFRKKNPNAQVFWAHLGTISKFSQACKTIARKLELPDWNDPQTNNLKQVHDWLSNDKNGQWLLVLDNVDDIEILETPLQLQNDSVRMSEFLPRSVLGAILVTTRDKVIGERLAVRGKTVKVSTMAMIEARQLLDSYLPPPPINEASCREDLIKDLDYLPLGITQAAAYITEKSITVQQYLSIFRDGDEEMQELLSENISDDRRIEQESHSVFRTWKLSFDQITKQNPRAAEMLSLMSMLDRQEIPCSVIKKDGEPTRVFLSATGVLQSFSLVSKSANGENFGMHRLVQFSTQAWLKLQGATSRWKREALFVLSHIFPCAYFENWRACEALLPHARLILQNKSDEDGCDLKRAKLLIAVAWFDREQSHYDFAISETQEAYDLFVRCDDNNKDNITALSCLTNKAECLIENGDYSVAEALLRDNLNSQKRVLGPHHRETLRTMGYLARALDRLQKYQESEELHRKTLIGSEQMLGSTHTGTIMSMNDLALVLQVQNKTSEAEDLQRKILASHEKMPGQNHPYTISSLINLATVLAVQNKIYEAKDLYGRALASAKNVLGSNHPRTLESQHGLARCLDKCGKHEEAERLFRPLIVSAERILGIDHPRFSILLNSLAFCLSNQSKHQEAEHLGRRALSLRKKTFGTDHIATATSRYNLARYLFNQGNFGEAAQLFQAVLVTEGKIDESLDGVRWKPLMTTAKEELEKCMQKLSIISNRDEA